MREGIFMLAVTLICVGRLKDAFFDDASAEYLKRLTPFAKVNTVEIKQAPLSEKPSQTEITKALEAEGAEITKKIPAGSMVIAMCIEGKQMSSEKFSRIFTDAALTGRSHITFIIGGSCGIADSVKRQADIRMSMSEMTFPHRLARVMLLEQIYRAFKIASGEKYHK